MMVIVSSAQERKLGFGVKAGVAATSLTIRVLILSLMVMVKTE